MTETIIRIALPVFMLGLFALAYSTLRRGFLTYETPQEKLIVRSYHNPRLTAEVKYTNKGKGLRAGSFLNFKGRNWVVLSDKKTSDLTRAIKCVSFNVRKGKA